MTFEEINKSNNIKEKHKETLTERLINLAKTGYLVHLEMDPVTPAYLLITLRKKDYYTVQRLDYSEFKAMQYTDDALLFILNEMELRIIKGLGV